MQHLKALLFSFNDLESSTRADKIAWNLESCGWETVVCDYSVTGGFNPRRLKRSANSVLLTLADLGFNSMPQLSSKKYQEAFGDDIDFTAISGLYFYSQYYPNSYPISAIFLNKESIFYQCLRGYAARIDHLMRALKPDLVISPHGSEVISRLITAKALKAEIPWLCSESSFFPGFLLLDPLGQHFLSGRNKIEADWSAVSLRELSNGETVRLTQFIQSWRESRTSKYQQEVNPKESARLDSFVADGVGPVLFVPMQIQLDANVYHGLGGFKSLQQFYKQLLAQLPLGWRAIFKPHPKNNIDLSMVDTSDARVLVVREVSIHDLINAADVVAVFSSNVGLEALLCDKPVIVGGKPYYGNKGLTIDAGCNDELPAAFELARTWQPESALRNKLLRYLLDDYLIREDDLEALLRRIEEARAKHPETDFRKPFSECDPPATAIFTDLIQRYDELARLNLMPSEILPRIGVTSFCAPNVTQRNDLVSGQRQVSAWLTRIEPGHLTRYEFVADLLPPGQSVLDLACGVGYGSYMLADRAKAQVVAVDGSNESINYAKKNWAHKNVAFEVASVGTFLESGKGPVYDAIVSFETIERLHDADLFLQQAWQYLRPGGVLFVSTSNCNVYPLLNCPFHIEHYDVVMLLEAFAKLPDVGACRIYRQHLNVISTTQVDNGALLVGVLFKAPIERALFLPAGMDASMPFTYNRPIAEFKGFRDMLKMLSRRRRWLKNMLSGKWR